jgi:hypothetical protein
VPPLPPKGEACGKNTCAVGEVCCNASCGICTPPNGGCILLACDTPPPPDQVGGCTTDADCHLERDYCTGCDCRAIGPKETIKVCSEAGVQCFADACLQKTAVCTAGKCAVAAAPKR